MRRRPKLLQFMESWYLRKISVDSRPKAIPDCYIQEAVRSKQSLKTQLCKDTKSSEEM